MSGERQRERRAPSREAVVGSAFALAAERDAPGDDLLHTGTPVQEQDLPSVVGATPADTPPPLARSSIPAIGARRIRVAQRPASTDAAALHLKQLPARPDELSEHARIRCVAHELLNDTMEEARSPLSLGGIVVDAEPPERSREVDVAEPEMANIVAELLDETLRDAAQRDESTARAAVSTPAPPIDGLPSAAPPQSPRRGSRALVEAAVAMASIALLWHLSGTSPSARRASGVTTPTPTSTAVAESMLTPPPSAAPASSPSSVATGEPLAPLSRPVSAVGRIKVTVAGHRVFVDGRLAGDGPRTVAVTCGSHEVRVGSAGTVRSVDVPCGGEVVIGYR